MATYAQRAKSFADALTNRATPITTITRLADAIAILKLVDPATLTQAQKAEMLVTHFRSLATAIIKEAENAPIAANAVSSNDASITSALSEG